MLPELVEGHERRGLAHVEAEGWRVFLRFLSLSKDGKNHDSPERTTQGYLRPGQSGAEAIKPISAAARSDQQASLTRQPADALRPERNAVEPKGAKAGAGGCHEEKEGAAKGMTSLRRQEQPAGRTALFLFL